MFVTLKTRIGKARYGNTGGFHVCANGPTHTYTHTHSHARMQIMDQSSTILWWTCGNMVTTTIEVARFFWALLGPAPTVLEQKTVESMKKFVPLNKVRVWAEGGRSGG